MKRECRIRAAVTKAEQQALLAIARLENRNPSETLRELVRQRAQELGVWRPHKEEEHREDAP
jgi:hypothetical protein